MRKCSTFYGVVAAGLTLLNAAGATARTVVPPPPQPASSAAWARSVKITAVAVPETDISELLDLHMWRFVVTAPKPARLVDYTVEVQEKGEPPRVLLSMHMDPNSAWPMNKRLTFSVGQYMPAGDHMDAVGKVKYQLRMSSYRPAPLTEYGGSASSGIVDNPFAGMRDWETFSSPERRPDGSFALITYTKDSGQSEKATPDAALVFRVQEREH